VESSGNVPVNRRSGVVSPDGRLANSGACSPGCTSDTLRLSCRSHASMASARSIPSLEPAPKGHSDRIAFHIILDRAAARGEWTLLSARRHHGAGSESGSLSCSVKILDFEMEAQLRDRSFRLVYAGCREQSWHLCGTRQLTRLCLFRLSASIGASKCIT
jgi:hypothetical protein